MTIYIPGVAARTSTFCNNSKLQAVTAGMIATDYLEAEFSDQMKDLPEQTKQNIINELLKRINAVNGSSDGLVYKTANPSTFRYGYCNQGIFPGLSRKIAGIQAMYAGHPLEINMPERAEIEAMIDRNKALVPAAPIIAPPPPPYLPSINTDGINPHSIQAGAVGVVMTIPGDNLPVGNNVSVELGEGVNVAVVNASDPKVILLTVSVDDNAAPGSRRLTIRRNGNEVIHLDNALTIGDKPKVKRTTRPPLPPPPPPPPVSTEEPVAPPLPVEKPVAPPAKAEEPAKTAPEKPATGAPKELPPCPPTPSAKTLRKLGKCK